GRQHQGGDVGPLHVVQVDDLKALEGGGLSGGVVLVPQHRLGGAGLQRARGGEPAAAEAEHGEALAGKAADGDHRSLSVDRPSSASAAATIQKRTTMVGSA